MGRKGGRRRESPHPEGRLRDEILQGLERVEAGAWANRLSPPSSFSADDRRRVTEYVGGITRLHRRLDFLIDAFSSRPDVDSVVRQILRIGAYELVELRRPPHSAVFASVEQAKRLANPGVARFVNGMLRSVSRKRDELPKPDTGDAVRDAAVECSHPDWMVRRWVDRYGLEDARRLMAYDNRRPVHTVRVNTLKTKVSQFCELLDEMEVEWTPSPYLPAFLRVGKLQAIVASGVLREGSAAIQDESAGLVGCALGAEPGEFVIDACAAPGGKLIHAGIRMENSGRIVGIDVDEKRLGRGVASARRHGLSIVEQCVADLRDLAPSNALPAADAVLLDAPCSGLGVLSRRADLRWRREEASIGELVALQDALLDAAARFVRSGGRLVYATCTIEPEENEERVEAFLSRHADFVVESLEGMLDVTLISGGFLQTLPHEHGIDGAFAARLRKR